MYDIFFQFDIVGSLVLLFLGLCVLMGGGEVLVRGASSLAISMRIPPLIVGLTVIAYCTSAPEFAVSLCAVLKGSADIAVGNVVGSNICNIGLVLGISAIFMPITISKTLLRRDIPIMLVASILVMIFAFSNTISTATNLNSPGRILPWQGAILTLCLLGFITWTIRDVFTGKEKAEEISSEESSESTKPMWLRILISIAFIAVGIAMLIAGSDMMVQGGVFSAHKLGVSELLIGLTVLAVGTSLPELVVSVIASIRGQNELAIGNAVGSCIFNIFAVLGPTALATNLTHAGSLYVSPSAKCFDIPVMLTFAIIAFVLAKTDRKITRLEGFALLFCYISYIVIIATSR